MRRMRRYRLNEQIRSMVRETQLHKSDLVYPIFVIEGKDIKNPVSSMPGIFQYSMDRIDEELNRIREVGIHAIIIFGIPNEKDEVGSGAYLVDGITQRAIQYIKEKEPNIIVIADVCLCEYTSHGHCGIVREGKVSNDETLPLLAKMAVTMAKAGADIIAPSDMMDGRVEEIREALDNSGYKEVLIMSYSAKFASSYYSPFREAAQSSPSYGDRKTYQMDFCNRKEAITECLEDIKEGADIIIIKPAMSYLDIVKEVSNSTNYPIAAYNVSGEYAMVKAAAAMGWIDERKIVLENMICMKRAGAKIIITYHALDVAKWLEE